MRQMGGHDKRYKGLFCRNVEWPDWVGPAGLVVLANADRCSKLTQNFHLARGLANLWISRSHQQLILGLIALAGF